MGNVIDFLVTAPHQEDLMLRHLLRTFSEEHGVAIDLEMPALRPYREGLRCIVRAYTHRSRITVYGFEPEQADAVKQVMDRARQQLFADTLLAILESAGVVRRRVT